MAMNKPITVARRDYMEAFIQLTNDAHLPAFVLIDILEQAVRELKTLAEKELARDEAMWQGQVEAAKDHEEEEGTS